MSFSYVLKSTVTAVFMTGPLFLYIFLIASLLSRNPNILVSCFIIGTLIFVMSLAGLKTIFLDIADLEKKEEEFIAAKHTYEEAAVWEEATKTVYKTMIVELHSSKGPKKTEEEIQKLAEMLASSKGITLSNKYKNL